MSDSVYSAVTSRITESLASGVVPWRKPWHTLGGAPCNAVSKRAYRGVNLVLLSLSPHADRRWLTFKQALELGGTVRKGEKSSLAVFWKEAELEQLDEESGASTKRRVPLLRYYHLFNVEQCEGVGLPPLPGPPQTHEVQRIEAAERLVKEMPYAPTIREAGNAAWYLPSEDLVQVPPRWLFHSLDAFYASLLHELGHASGHESRLARPGITGSTRFGSELYSREELIAELTSAFCCASVGLDNSLVGNAASYIAGWLRALKDDPKALVIAAAQAQRAADYIRGIAQAVS